MTFANDEFGPDEETLVRPQGPPPGSGITADIALQYLAYAQGDAGLAASRLGLDDADTLLGLMALDETVHPRAQAVFRFMQLAKLLGALSVVEDSLLSKIEGMEAKETAKLYGTMVMAAELLTKAAGNVGPGSGNYDRTGSTGGTQNNITVNLMRMLPPEVREAMKVLLPQNDSLSDALPSNSLIHASPPYGTPVALTTVTSNGTGA